MGAAAAHQHGVRAAGHRVEVTATALGPGIPGVQAYHTSVTVDDTEFAFDVNGISPGPPGHSHQFLKNEPVVRYVGVSALSCSDMLKALGPFFFRGSYDLLRKNCNSFSDCALFCLLGLRLDPRYRSLEKMGQAVDELACIVQIISEGFYRPNPCANGFDVEKVVQKMCAMKQHYGLAAVH
uniref:PPPDE domain-containing protein n=1 Tax=Zooxanthella nutricula TaxID=1333877 RepID=A0A7S2M6Y3_9DINO|mmetsp:Transcript_73332/g.224312  ORF Transcript_73332/g.224312 Transcript_73332/m.224312 type:complete len:181 (+) Transcript_73332:83-625(+)